MNALYLFYDCNAHKFQFMNRLHFTLVWVADYSIYFDVTNYIYIGNARKKDNKLTKMAIKTSIFLLKYYMKEVYLFGKASKPVCKKNTT